ncbi:hypothetical protein ACFP1Z_28135 [Streptomyces gamaensis]|uniref:Uncharacterized protein n=1 Tax=Streptomyces gamaensis TaxID=1763542 RepID=A0ABW0Z8C0_9ACTN
MRIAQKILTGIAAVSLSCATLFGLSAVPAQAVSTSPISGVATPSASISGNEYSVRTTFFNRNGEDVPLREGNLDFGYRHIQDKHPENDYSLYGWIHETLEGGTYKDDKYDHTKVIVRGLLVTGQTFRVVYSEREAPDGRPVGIVTAYVE